MKPRLLILPACLLILSAAHGIGPKPKPRPEPESLGPDATLPLSQEATEDSVLPEEPMLSTPTPEPLDAVDTTGLPVQPVPSAGISQPTGPTVDERRQLAEAFRLAKSEAQEDFTLADIKIRAFAAPTEREKRALLREYYLAVATSIAKKSPALGDRAQVWAYSQQNRLARRRTEPDYVTPERPSAVARLRGNVDEEPSDKPADERANLLPALEN